VNYVYKREKDVHGAHIRWAEQK